MGTGSWIILLLLGVGWAVQAIAQAVAKKQEQERLRQVAEQRRQQAQRQSGRSTPTAQPQPEPRASSGRPSSRPTSREELAARRQAQLEELRKRRMAQSRGQQPSTQVRTGQPSQRQTPPTRQPQARPAQRRSTSTAAPPPQQRPYLQPDDVPRRAVQRPSEKLREKDDFGGRLADLRRKQAEQKAMQKRARTSRAASPRLRDKPIDEQSLVAPDPFASRRVGVDVSSLRTRLRQPAMLRELFIMKELLDPPVSLRSEPRPGSVAL